MNAWPPYTVWLAGGILIAAFGGWQHLQRRSPMPAARWAEVCLAALAGAILGGRALHVLTHADYFRLNLAEALSPSAGGLDWHGAVWGGLVLAWGYSRVARLPFRPVLPALALALPILVAAAWGGCVQSPNNGCAVGREVATLADYPPLVVAELRDVFGIVAPRWNLPLFGICVAALLLLVVGWQRRAGAGTGGFWWALALLAGGMFALGFLRADTVLMLGILRADQCLDLLTCAAALVCAARGRSPAPAEAHTIA